MNEEGLQMNIGKYGAVLFMTLFSFMMISCDSSDIFSGKWHNETIDREILIITKSDNGYTVDAPYGSFPCLREDSLLKCKIGFGDTVFHINDEKHLIMRTPVGLQFKFKRKEQ